MILQSTLNLYDISLHTVVYCEAAPVPVNGRVTFDNPSQPTTYNSSVTYTCEVGFELSGTAQRRCTATGEWSGSIPSCTGKSSIWQIVMQRNRLGSAELTNMLMKLKQPAIVKLYHLT